jgi:NADH:ubiquinone oxidoreductase subunit F (NADH-binding)
VLSNANCGIAETARIAQYMADQSAGQCGPCVFGLPTIASDLLHLATGSRPLHTGDLRPQLERRFDVVSGRGACRHPDGAVRMARSALSVFAIDVAGHAAGRPCGAWNRPSVLTSWFATTDRHR